MDEARHILREVFGFAAFRGEQEAIVGHVAAGGDALVLMPTGGGKSLCYQVPALLRPGTGIVVSPLIALMRDQVRALQQAGVRAAYLNSTLTPGEARQVEADLLGGRLDLLYAAPERLLTDRTLDLLERTRVALFAIDEAAVTATADPPTRREIVERLGLAEARTFVSGFDRPNIRYRVVAKQSPRDQLLRFLGAEHPRDAGIV
ncbi:MAG: DEAD/DEAH box helicase, partial [Gammaproteobacteria bacterium]|nr:DEAD/DEAH box helicase [Gammaproteobacteria bacterium]